MTTLLRRLHRALHHIEDGLIVAVLLLMIMLTVLQVLLRNFCAPLEDPWYGSSVLQSFICHDVLALKSVSILIEPLLQNAVLWIGLLGAMIASRNDEHIRIDVASSLLPEKYHPFLTTFVDLFTAFICVLVAWYSVGFVIEEYEYAGMAFASVPSWLLQAIIPVGFSVMAVRYVVLFLMGLVGKRPKMQEPHA